VRVGRDVDRHPAALDDVAVLGHGVARRYDGHGDAVDRRLVPPVEVDHVAEEAMGQVGGEETISAGGITSPSRR